MYVYEDIRCTFELGRRSCHDLGMLRVIDRAERQRIELCFLHCHLPAVNNRGKSYNIRMDGDVLVKFSPKNPASTYMFGDMVRGCR